MTLSHLRSIVLPALVGAAFTAAPARAQYIPLTFEQVNALPAPAADHRISYGSDSLQFGELRLPEGRGPFPVVEIIHGGCWRAEYGIGYTRAMAAALVQEGYAVWSIEYRRAGNPGGGWPGTFLDVASGTDKLRDLAKLYPLDTTRLLVIGHSAGGQLALWLAARGKMPKASPLSSPTPMRVGGVVSLAGITDLRTYGAITDGCHAAVSQVVGGTPAEHPDRYAQLSPVELLPIGVPIQLLNGFADPIVSREQASTFATKAHAAGDDATYTLLEREGHFDLVAPSAPAWEHIIGAVRSAMPAPLPSVESIIAKSLVARGGLARLHKVKSVRMAGTIALADDAPGRMLVEIQRPGKMREEIAVRGGTLIQTTDSKTGWALNPNDSTHAAQALSQDEVKNMAGGADFDGPLLNRAARGIGVVLLGRMTVRGRETYQLLVTMPDGEMRRDYIDRETFMEDKWEGNVKADGSFGVESFFSDYRNVKDVQFAFAVDSDTPGTPYRQKIRFNTVEADVKFPSSRFSKP